MLYCHFYTGSLNKKVRVQGIHKINIPNSNCTIYAQTNTPEKSILHILLREQFWHLGLLLYGHWLWSVPPFQLHLNILGISSRHAPITACSLPPQVLDLLPLNSWHLQYLGRCNNLVLKQVDIVRLVCSEWLWYLRLDSSITLNNITLIPIPHAFQLSTLTVLISYTKFLLLYNLTLSDTFYHNLLYEVHMLDKVCQDHP